MKKIISIILALMLVSAFAVTAYADQKSTAVNKEIIYVDGYMEPSYETSGTITIDQIVKLNGVSDTTATIYLIYDNNYIYVFGSVKDKTRITVPYEHEWTTDSVEIQLDLDCNEAGQTVGSGYTGLFRVVRYSGNVVIAESNTSPVFTAMKDAIQCSVLDKGVDGYDFEIAIPHANGFKSDKLGVSCIVNDAADNVKGLTAMIFMNNKSVGSYTNTKDFYKFTLNNFNNKRPDNAPTYVSSAAETSSEVSSEASSEISSEISSEVTSDETSSNTATSKSDIPQQNNNSNGGIDPIIICVGVSAFCLIVIVITVIIAVKKKSKKQ